MEPRDLTLEDLLAEAEAHPEKVYRIDDCLF